MADIDNLQIKITADLGNADKKIDKLTDSLGRLSAQIDALNVGNLDGVTNTIKNLGDAFSTLSESTKSLKNVTINVANITSNSGDFANVADSVENLGNAMKNAAEGAKASANATREATGENSKLDDSQRKVAESAKSAAKSLKDTSKSASSSKGNFKGLVKELTRVGKMLKLMVTRMVLRKVIQGVLDGFKNLAQYSSTFDASLSLLWNSFRQLGNSIAAAVSPLINAFAPAINYVIQLVIKAVNVINQLISALTGMGTWTRAKTLTDDYAKSLDKSNKSAKALKKTVLGFDELNQLQDNNSGGGGGTSPADMFEKVPIDPRILKFVDDLKKKIGELGKYWDSFKKGFGKGLGDDWKDKVALIKDGAVRIQKALADIWNDPNVSKARDEYFLSLAETIGAVAGTVARVGLNIGANLAQGIANSIEEKSPEIKEHLEEMFNIGTHTNKQVEDFSLAIGRMSDVLVGENAIAATTGFSNLFIESFMLIQENAARLGDAIVTLVTQPIIDNESKLTDALDGMFGILASFADFAQGVVGDIRQTLSDVWEQHLSPMFDSLTKGLSDVVGILTDAWNNNIQPVLQELMDTLKPLWEQYIKPIADDILHIIGIIGNLLAKVFKSIIVPVFREFVEKWMPRIQDALSIAVSAIKLVFQTASTIIQYFTGILRMLLQFIETAFTKGWSAACDEINQSWADMWDNILEKLKGIANTIIDIVQKMLNGIGHGINSVIDKVSGLKDIPIPAMFGGGTWTFSGLKALHIGEVDLSKYKFANGGFPRENGFFFANSSELVGRFSNGKTAVANNEQITDGIARAVFNAISSANSMSGNNVPVNTTIMLDGMVLARATTQGQRQLDRRYSPSTT